MESFIIIIGVALTVSIIAAFLLYKHTKRKGYLIGMVSILPTYIGLIILPFSKSIFMSLLLTSFFLFQIGFAFLGVEKSNNKKIKLLFIFSSIILLISGYALYFLAPSEYTLIGILSLLFFYRAANFIGAIDENVSNNENGRS